MVREALPRLLAAQAQAAAAAAAPPSDPSSSAQPPAPLLPPRTMSGLHLLAVRLTATSKLHRHYRAQGGGALPEVRGGEGGACVWLGGRRGGRFQTSSFKPLLLLPVYLMPACLPDAACLT